MKTEEKLKKISKILDRYEKEIKEAHKQDGEVTYGGNGINAAECELLITPLFEEIRDVIELS